MKTKEELNALKNEVEALNAKLGELTEEEMEQVTGGETWWPVEQKQPTDAEAVGQSIDFGWQFFD